MVITFSIVFLISQDKITSTIISDHKLDILKFLKFSLGYPQTGGLGSEYYCVQEDRASSNWNVSDQTLMEYNFIYN
jgi:hypothetical protein